MAEKLRVDNRTPKGKAARWTKASPNAWDIDFQGHKFAATKPSHLWQINYFSPELDDWRVALMDAAKTQRGAWVALTDWLNSGGHIELIKACIEEARAAGLIEDEPVNTANVSERIANALEAVADLNAEIEDAPEPDHVPMTNGDPLERALSVSCPKCGASGATKCHTSGGKTVKENGGFHAARKELMDTAAAHIEV